MEVHGGTGSITLTQVAADLICKDKNIIVQTGEIYKLGEINLIEQTKNQDSLMIIGNIKYEVLDETIAQVNEDGQITGIKEGRTKVKITDTKNNINTYVFLQVVDKVKVDVQEGQNFTVALRKDGRVWSYGLNNKGQLGIGNNENKNAPTQIDGIQDIEQIAVRIFT